MTLVALRRRSRAGLSAGQHVAFRAAAGRSGPLHRLVLPHTRSVHGTSRCCRIGVRSMSPSVLPRKILPRQFLFGLITDHGQPLGLANGRRASEMPEMSSCRKRRPIRSAEIAGPVPRTYLVACALGSEYSRLVAPTHASSVRGCHKARLFWPCGTRAHAPFWPRGPHGQNRGYRQTGLGLVSRWGPGGM